MSMDGVREQIAQWVGRRLFFGWAILFAAGMGIFISGAGKNTLTMPEGAGYNVASGTQLVLQLHLLNATPMRTRLWR